MDRLGVLLLAALVVLSGCAGADGPFSDFGDGAGDAPAGSDRAADTSETTAGATGATTETGSAVENATATEADAESRAASRVTTAEASSGAGVTASTPASASGAVDADNPWGRRMLTVGVSVEDGARADTDRNYAALVRQALRYWNTGGQRYGTYDAQYQLDPDATDPDIEVRFVDRVDSCGREAGKSLLGCAPQLRADSRVQRPVTVRIETGYSDATTVDAVKHELGHVRGLTHDDDPAFMRASRVAYTLPQRDAVDRAYPWQTSDFTVFVDDTNVPAADRPTFRRQVTHALDYYERGPAGVPANVSFTVVDDPDRADIVVRYLPDATGQAGSRSATVGTDPDGDDAIEYRTGATVEIEGIDVDRTGYHVGYWLGKLLGAEDDADLPPPFRGDTDPASEWWT